MADVEYKHDYRGVPQLAKSAEMHMVMIDKAFEGMAFAKSISPDAPPYGAGYIEGFRVDGGHYETINGTKRAVAYLYNDSDHAWYVERGTSRSANVAHHVLSRTVDFLEHS